MFSKIWEWLNGNKTAIGFLFLWLVTQAWFKAMLPDGTTEDAVVAILEWLGGILAGVGVIHKVVKAKTQ